MVLLWVSYFLTTGVSELWLEYDFVRLGSAEYVKESTGVAHVF